MWPCFASCAARWAEYCAGTAQATAGPRRQRVRRRELPNAALAELAVLERDDELLLLLDEPPRLLLRGFREVAAGGIAAQLVAAMRGQRLDPGPWQLAVFMAEELAQATPEGTQILLPVLLCPSDVRAAYEEYSPDTLDDMWAYKSEIMHKIIEADGGNWYNKRRGVDTHGRKRARE